MSDLISCHKPPVNGNVCESFIALNKGLSSVAFEWDDNRNEFIIYGTDVSVSYFDLERSYDLFVWDSDL